MGLGAALGWLSLSATRQLFVARERLLAGDTASATVALRRVHWPQARGRAAAGEALARALLGGEAAAPPPVAELSFFEPEAIVAGAIQRGALDAAERLARVLCQAHHPLGPLYAAALAFERGDELLARQLVARSPVPLSARGLGARLSRALAARAAGARRLVLDRTGELVAVVDASGLLQPTPEAAPYLAEALHRLAAVEPALLEDAPALRLSVDHELSRLASEALGEERGSIVLLEPRSGAVLAAVTDPITSAKEPDAAFEQRREPASIAKLLTAAAAYASGHDPDALIGRMTCTGVERYDGKPLWCPFPSGRLAGLDHALAVSCNLAFANLAMVVGRERLLEEYRRWGFDAKSPALLGAAGRVETEPRGARQLADLAIGLELESITPLHAALLAAAVANDGRMPEPVLVTAGGGPLGLRETPRLATAARVVTEPAVARRLTKAMAAVAQYGTAAGLAPAGLQIAMKTGTASAPGLGYHVNYVGFLTVSRPSLAFCVRLTGLRGSRRIHAAAHAVTGRLLESLSAWLAARPAAPPSPAPAPAPSR